MKQTKTSKNTDNSYENIIIEKIAKILNKDPVELMLNSQELGFKNSIKSIIEENSNNQKLLKYYISEVNPDFFAELDQELKSNKDIVLIAIRANSKNFKFINKKLKEDERLAKEVIKSMIREGKDYFNIKEFIGINFKKISKKLLKFYRKELKKYDKILKNDFSNDLLVLSKKNEKFFELLKQKNVIAGKKQKLIIDTKFIKSFQKFINDNKEYTKLDDDKKNQLKLDYIAKILGINLEEISSDSLNILYQIINQINLKEDTSNINDGLKNDDGDDEGDEFDFGSGKTNEKSDSEEDLFKNKLDYSLPNCSYKSYSSYSEIKTIDNIIIKISNKEKDNFSSKALKNFVKFYSLLERLRLNFLWDKYKTGITTLASNKFGFDYLHGEGITESKTLSFLNLVGKNIGIPEYEVIGDDGETKKELKCFKTLGEAILKFEDIKSSSLINNEYIETSMGTQVVEKKLHLGGKIDMTKGEFFMANW